uniref:Nucleosome assembly protein n=1 Tax=Leptocylindrus danicus TaxID=163516 RepID=A0A7S2K4H4_9STRA|mmetsp:Transcript_17617/g.26226  ORF Transcript_17617/g.26226 Transcript_17617/m.26226 type:complete len:335 (+) Transcript_17617:151-1155(+)|eukprot:CAMPEP_0116033630 /NCGR_PEP_ID=MMETSP0321-20121206/19117_1 /TAXON_ID=163516 /ORGANISM="Leptocylindrus danicus var. danicus, Strain B650" /LENGTH=334 /DNA_ID=CAMNT_0003509769 /DNA_START=117 /DNA_END=1121 /DNA_ORIENTATION=-
MSDKEVNEAANELAVANLGDTSEEEEEDEDYDEEDIMDTLPPVMKMRVNKLQELQDQKNRLMEEYVKERAMLEHKYATLSEPLYDARKDIIVGAKDDELKLAQGDEESDAIVGIPQFWVVAIGHLEVVGELVTESDVDCLEYLRDIKCEDFENGMGFTLKFFFAPNDYFTNEVLEKKYTIPNLLMDDEPVLQEVLGCDIDWKEGRNLCYKKVQKKQRAKRGPNAGQIRTVTKQERLDSFFHFFTPPKLPKMEEMDEEEADALEEAFDHDYDVAQSFRSHIIPNAVLWFTGEALDSEFDLGEGELEGAVVEGGNDNNSPFPAPVEGEENPECKQN